MKPPARRSLSAALKMAELSPEATAFLKEGTPKPMAETPASMAPVVDAEIISIGNPSVSTNVTEVQRPMLAKGTPSRAETLGAIPSLTFTSLRLPAEIPQALLHASFDRKLKREKPWTQQDIAAEALAHWLKKHGYL